MKLTNKAKEQFEKWYLKELNPVEYTPEDESDDYAFYNLPESLQWGVMQDFADSLGYDLYITKDSPVNYYWAVSDLINCLGCKENVDHIMTRQEARNAAIEKLNEILNEK